MTVTDVTVLTSLGNVLVVDTDVVVQEQPSVSNDHRHAQAEVDLVLKPSREPVTYNVENNNKNISNMSFETNYVLQTNTFNPEDESSVPK